MSIKVTKAHWFSPIGGHIGIVIGTDDITGETKAYIGIANGLNEQADEKHIAETGAKITAQRAVELIKDLETIGGGV